MLEFIKFSDQCVITRDNGGHDGWDNQINPEVIYDGECCFQEGGTTYTRVFTMRNPTVYIPSADGRVKINDAIKITTEFGREIQSFVKAVRDINLQWRENVKVTRIELKQAKGE